MDMSDSPQKSLKSTLKPALQTVVFEKPATKPQPTLEIVLQMTSENISYKNTELVEQNKPSKYNFRIRGFQETIRRTFLNH